MKQVFECGIVGEAHTPQGEAFLLAMNVPSEVKNLRSSPDLIEFEVDHWRYMDFANYLEFDRKIVELCERMIAAGFDAYSWEQMDRMVIVFRFKRRTPAQ